MARKTPQNPYGLTVKERKWLAIYIDTGNATKAIKEVYNYSTESSARAQGSMLLSKLSIPVADLLDAMGLSDGALHKRLMAGLDAMRTEIVRHEGKISEEKEYIDHGTRATYLALAYKLKGKLINRVAHQDSDGNVIGPVILPAIPDTDPKTPQLPDVDPKRPIKAPGGAQA